MTSQTRLALAHLALFSAAMLALSGCYAGQASPVPDGGGVIGPSADGVPCDVAAVLRRTCYGCHTGTRSNVLLVSYADLTKPSKGDPSKTVIERSVELMRATSPQMPPMPRPRAAESDIAVLEAWIAVGTPMGGCTEDAGVYDAGPSEYDTPTVCTSGSMWRRGEDQFMTPGRACTSCHQIEGEGPLFDIAGTVYPTAHEPDDCNGADGTATDGAVVVVKDRNGIEYRFATNRVGNFGGTRTGVAFPYIAWVEFQGRTREMVSPQMSGECNSCHTAEGTATLDGSYAAPGRIMLP